MAEVFWEVMEKRLAALLSVMPGINPANLGDEPQQFLASYMPPGSWGEEEKALLRQFAEMDSRAFKTSMQAIGTRCSGRVPSAVRNAVRLCAAFV